MMAACNSGQTNLLYQLLNDNSYTDQEWSDSLKACIRTNCLDGIIILLQHGLCLKSIDDLCQTLMGAIRPLLLSNY